MRIGEKGSLQAEHDTDHGAVIVVAVAGATLRVANMHCRVLPLPIQAGGKVR